jgi:hypothetical protein
MAVADVSAAHQDTVSAKLEGLQDEIGRDPSGTHDPDHPDVGRVLDATHPGEIGAGISTPVAAKGDEFGFEVSGHDGFVLRLKILRTAARQIRNSKHEIRNKFKTRISEISQG